MTSKPTKYTGDDERVICSMDVEGMPWHDRRVQKTARSAVQGNLMTRAEMRRYVWNSVLAGLLIVAVFSAAWVLFILFCTQVWFR